jgi:hypothetical protein
MNTKLLIAGITLMLVAIGLCGCIDEITDSESDIETIEISGMDLMQTINKPGKKIRLDVSGINCDITVSKKTNLAHIDVSGMNCIIRVSRSHSFTSDISGIDSEIVYYD